MNVRKERERKSETHRMITSSWSPGSFMYSGREVTDTCEGVRRGLRGLLGLLDGFGVGIPEPATSALIALVSCSAGSELVADRLAEALANRVARLWRRIARPRQVRVAKPTHTTKMTTVGV